MWATLFCTGELSDAVHPSVESKQSAWKTSGQWVPLKHLKYLLNGLRSEVPPQQIWNSHIILHSSWLYWWSLRLKLDFSLRLHRNSKLLMTLCPPLSATYLNFIPLWEWMWHHCVFVLKLSVFSLWQGLSQRPVHPSLRRADYSLDG